MLRIIRRLVFIVSASLFISINAYSNAYYEIDGSPFATEGALVPETIKSSGEKIILVDPAKHAFGAYDHNGKLIRWGIATAGGDWCRDIAQSCRTSVGTFRIYSAGDDRCYSKKYPLPSGGAPMPYCMYFNGGQALHGASNVMFNNESHGCVRVHDSDAKWLRYQFIESPSKRNRYRGTMVVVRSYGATWE